MGDQALPVSPVGPQTDTLVRGAGLGAGQHLALGPEPGGEREVWRAHHQPAGGPPGGAADGLADHHLVSGQGRPGAESVPASS